MCVCGGGGVFSSVCIIVTVCLTKENKSKTKLTVAGLKVKVQGFLSMQNDHRND